MALKFQFNKTESQRLQKQLKVRYIALPILKSKEAALRAEIKKLKEEYVEIEKELARYSDSLAGDRNLFNEFDLKVKLKEVGITSKKIAGVDIPELGEVVFDVPEYSMFTRPAWYNQGLVIMKKLISLDISKLIAKKRVDILEKARRKTTQKVNLYEKVQIPELEQAISKIKRMLEDTENLEKSSQKIVKKRLESMELVVEGGSV